MNAHPLLANNNIRHWTARMICQSKSHNSNERHRGNEQLAKWEVNKQEPDVLGTKATTAASQ
jgi:hypothetical protein